MQLFINNWQLHYVHTCFRVGILWNKCIHSLAETIVITVSSFYVTLKQLCLWNRKVPENVHTYVHTQLDCRWGHKKNENVIILRICALSWLITNLLEHAALFVFVDNTIKVNIISTIQWLVPKLKQKRKVIHKKVVYVHMFVLFT